MSENRELVYPQPFDLEEGPDKSRYGTPEKVQMGTVVARIYRDRYGNAHYDFTQVPLDLAMSIPPAPVDTTEASSEISDKAPSRKIRDRLSRAALMLSGAGVAAGATHAASGSLLHDGISLAVGGAAGIGGHSYFNHSAKRRQRVSEIREYREALATVETQVEAQLDDPSQSIHLPGHSDTTGRFTSFLPAETEIQVAIVGAKKTASSKQVLDWRKDNVEQAEGWREHQLAHGTGQAIYELLQSSHDPDGLWSAIYPQLLTLQELGAETATLGSELESLGELAWHASLHDDDSHSSRINDVRHAIYEKKKAEQHVYQTAVLTSMVLEETKRYADIKEDILNTMATTDQAGEMQPEAIQLVDIALDAFQNLPVDSYTTNRIGDRVKEYLVKSMPFLRKDPTSLPYLYQGLRTQFPELQLPQELV